MYRSWLLIAVMALVVAACGGEDSGVEDSTPTTGAAGTTTTAGTEEPQSTTTTTAAPTESGGESMGSIVVDGETFEFPDVFECQIGQEGGSPDYRDFGARSEDGSADISISYYPPEDAFAGLTGVSLDREVDGSDWTYASSYAGSDGQFTIDLADNGASGTAEIGVVGVGNPYGGETLVSQWSFNCG